MLMSYNLNDEHQCFSEENLSETEDVERRRCCVFQVLMELEFTVFSR